MRTGFRQTALLDEPETTPAGAGYRSEDEANVRGPVLLLEVGSTATRAALVDLVDGQHRFVASGVAPTTLGLAVSDVTPGLRGAIAEIEKVTRRRLADSMGLIYPERPDGGLNAALLTAGSPLRVAVLPFGERTAQAEVGAALTGSGVVMLDVTRLDEVRRSGGSPLGRLLDVLRREPDVLLALGPLEAERNHPSVDVAQYLSAALQRTTGPRPAVLFVGTSEVAKRLTSVVAKWADFRPVDVAAANVPGAIQEELRTIWRDRLTGETSGYSAIQSWVSRPAVPIAEALATALRFLALRRSTVVWGIDVGGSTTCLVRAWAKGATIHVAEVGAARQVRWALAEDVLPRLLPGADPEHVRDLLLNRALRPWASPEMPDEQAVSRALVREAIRAVCRTAGAARCGWRGEIGLVVVRGGALRPTADPAADAWAVADGLGATGTFELALDQHGLLPGLGALAAVSAQPAGEVAAADALAPLATMVVGDGKGHTGEPAARAELRILDGRRRQADAFPGQAVALPLDPWEVADLTLTPSDSFDFGWGRGRKIELRVRGGVAGLLVGARDGSGSAAQELRAVGSKAAAGGRSAAGVPGEG